MSRNTEYQFVSTDTDDLIAYMVSIYEAITSKTVLPASPEMLFIRWVAAIILQERNLLNYAANQNIPSRAEGESLDALAELFYAQQRPAATPATCTMRFRISAAQSQLVLIPAGTRVTDSDQNFYWRTQEDVYIAIGDTYVDATVVCTEPGADANGFALGQINTIVDVYEYYSACENITVSDAGSDQMSDDDFYELLRLSMDATSTAGAHGSYVYHALSASSEINDVVVNSPSDGEVRIYALMDNGTAASSEVKAAISAKCNAEDTRPLTDYVVVSDPETVAYNITLTYYIPSDMSASSAEIVEKVTAAVDDYNAWQSGKLGRDINPSELIRLVMQAGAKRVTVTAPVFTALDKTQVAIADEVTVNMGGFEDE